MEEVASMLYFIFINLLGPAILVVGLVGNVLTFLVFSRAKFERTSMAIYLRAAAVTDTLAILHLMRVIATNQYHWNVKSQAGAFMCHFTLYSVYAVCPMSVWCVVIVSFDRMISIVFMNRFKFLRDKVFQLSFVAFVIVLNTCLYLPFAIYSQYIPASTNVTSAMANNISSVVEIHKAAQCILSDYISNIMFWIDLVNLTILPFACMIVFTTVTVVFIFKSRLRMLNHSSSGEDHSAMKVLAKDINFAVTSVALNMNFLFLNLPIEIFWIISNSLDENTYDCIYPIFIVMFYANYGNLFLVNIGFNRIFQTEFKGLLGIQSSGKKKTGASSTNTQHTTHHAPVQHH